MAKQYTLLVGSSWIYYNYLMAYQVYELDCGIWGIGEFSRNQRILEIIIFTYFRIHVCTYVEFSDIITLIIYLQLTMM